jgi:hypothetical protein
MTVAPHLSVDLVRPSLFTTRSSSHETQVLDDQSDGYAKQVTGKNTGR